MVSRELMTSWLITLKEVLCMSKHVIPFMRGVGPQYVTTYSYTVCWAELQLKPSGRQGYLEAHQTGEKKRERGTWKQKENQIFIKYANDFCLMAIFISPRCIYFVMFPLKSFYFKSHSFFEIVIQRGCIKLLKYECIKY